VLKKCGPKSEEEALQVTTLQQEIWERNKWTRHARYEKTNGRLRGPSVTAESVRKPENSGAGIFRNLTEPPYFGEECASKFASPLQSSPKTCKKGGITKKA